MNTSYVLDFEDVMVDVTSHFKKIDTNQYRTTGLTPIVDQSANDFCGYTDIQPEVASISPPYIIFGDHTRRFKFVDVDFVLGADGTKVLKTKIDADHKYLFHFFKSIKLEEAGYSRHYKFLKRTKLFVPPLAEQQRIAALLDTADHILKQRESAIAKLDQLAQSVFSQIFIDAKHSVAIKKLSEICDVRDGTHDSPKYLNEGIPLITSKNLTRGFIDFSNVNLISSNDFFEINKRSKVDCGDILMPMIGTIGNPVIVKDKNPNFAIKNVALIKQTPNSPNSIYLKAVLEGATFKSYIEKISRGGTQKFLGLGDIRKFEISIVNKKIEEEFVSFINKLNNMRDLYVISALKQKEMLVSLQHQSFTVN